MPMLAKCSRLSHMDACSPPEQLQSAAKSLAGLSGQRQPYSHTPQAVLISHVSGAHHGNSGTEYV